jgi:hypothetical protein
MLCPYEIISLAYAAKPFRFAQGHAAMRFSQQAHHRGLIANEIVVGITSAGNETRVPARETIVPPEPDDLDDRDGWWSICCW